MPASARDARFRLSPDLALTLAEQFGTPLYVLSESHLRGRIREYRAAFRAVAPGSRLVFASKANSTLAVLKIAHQEGCLIDVASEGELRAALLAGIPASDCHLHGNYKTMPELAFAFAAGVGEIVVDSFAEIEMLSELARSEAPPSAMVAKAIGLPAEEPVRCPDLVIRVAPGVDPATHQKISTGQDDTKFGFNLADGSAERALLRCLELGLPVVGFHCHVGSQLLDPEAQRAGGEAIAQLAADMLRRHGFETKVLNVGGGLGVRYTDADDPMAVEDYCRLVVEAMRAPLEGTGLDPVLMQEPGRSLVAEAGVTLYRVGVVKTVPTGEGRTRTYASVDGGLSDNPRPALYGSRYTVLRAARVDQSDEGEAGAAKFTVAGRHCETDKLFVDVDLPADLAEGDLLQVLCTGAYNSSMASNYNRFLRPATVLVREDGSLAPVQRRETYDELFAREILPAL
ncbi:MAG: diaminopimelate decarboxylase [Fimbriimonadales bacterium]|nr:diaminopimelate decarboxylase [Fimbriimonadales bacterium]